MSNIAKNIEVDELQQELVQLLAEKSDLDNKIRESSKNIKNLDEAEDRKSEESVTEAATATLESRNNDARISSIQHRSTKLKSILQSKFSRILQRSLNFMQL